MTLIDWDKETDSGSLGIDDGSVTRTAYVSTVLNANLDDACNDDDLPDDLEPYSGSRPDLQLRRRTGNRIARDPVNDFAVWKIDLEYSTDPVTGTNSPGNDPEAPEDWTPIMRTDPEFVDYPALAVRQGSRGYVGPVQNSAGTVFSQGATFKVPRAFVTIEKNFLSLDHISICNTYMRCLNSSTYFGCPPHTWLFLLCKPVTKKIKNLSYLAGLFMFIFDADGHDYKPLDVGPKYYAAVGNTDGETPGEKYSFRTEDGFEDVGFLNGINGQKSTSGPVFLDGQGGRNGPFVLYPTANLSGLGLSENGANYIHV